MKQLAALAWKEWREVRAFLWIALGVFLGLPIIAGAEAMMQYSRRFEISASPWVLMFGGVLAVFVAVGATCRDFSGHLEDFWRSRPVGVRRWLVVKYLVGLTVVLVACVLPMAVEYSLDHQDEYSLDHQNDWIPAICGFLVMLPAFFSVGFLAGCLVRRAAHAAMLALAAMLLILFLPVVLPPIKWLSAQNIRGLLGTAALYAAGMVGIALLALMLAIVAAQRGWRVEAGRKMMYGAVGLAILILFSSAAFQLGTNMPILQEVPLPQAGWMNGLRCEGNRGFVQIFPREPVNLPGNHDLFIPFEVTPGGIKLEPASDSPPFPPREWDAVSPAGHPEISYQAWDMEYIKYVNAREQYCHLQVRQFDRYANLWQPYGSLQWQTSIEGDTPRDKEVGSFDMTPVTYVWNNRLYVMGRRLVTLDISEPLVPRIISNELFSLAFLDDSFWRMQFGDSNTASNQGAKQWSLTLPPVPGLPAMQRLEMELRVGPFYHPACFDGKILCAGFGGSLVAYKLTTLTDTKAVFGPIGQYRPTILESAFGSFRYYGLQMENGLVYVLSDGRIGPSGVGGWLNPHISVFDVRGTGIRLVGHFAAPGAAEVCPLPDGRAIVAGSKLWPIGPPPNQD